MIKKRMVFWLQGGSLPPPPPPLSLRLAPVLLVPDPPSSGMYWPLRAEAKLRFLLVITFLIKGELIIEAFAPIVRIPTISGVSAIVT